MVAGQTSYQLIMVENIIKVDLKSLNRSLEQS